MRFGSDATNDKIWIGELASTWSYPQIVIKEVMLGYTSALITWQGAWSVDFEATAFDTVDETVNSGFPMARGLDVTTGQAIQMFIADVEKMRVHSDGNVGIGFAAPATRLDIDTGSNTTGLRLRGVEETLEIADLYVGANGQLVLSTASTGDGSAFIELDASDDPYGLVLRDSNTGVSAYTNFFNNEAGTDYFEPKMFELTTATWDLLWKREEQWAPGRECRSGTFAYTERSQMLYLRTCGAIMWGPLTLGETTRGE